MGASTRITADFQIEIPEDVRGAKALQPGQEIVFLQEGDSFVLVPLPARDELFGIAEGANPNFHRDRNDRY